MTPQMLITIPQAAIFGPQNRRDGMFVSGLHGRSNGYFCVLFMKLNKISEGRHTATEPHGQLILITRLHSVLFVTSSEATNENVR